MTKIEQEWLLSKQIEMGRWLLDYQGEWQGSDPRTWDAFTFLTIITDLQDEIRRLKTKTGRKR